MLNLITNTWQVHPILVAICLMAIISGIVTSINYYNKWFITSKHTTGVINQMNMDKKAAEKEYNKHISKLNAEILRLQKENKSLERSQRKPKKPENTSATIK